MLLKLVKIVYYLALVLKKKPSKLLLNSTQCQFGYVMYRELDEYHSNIAYCRSGFDSTVKTLHFWILKGVYYIRYRIHVRVYCTLYA